MGECGWETSSSKPVWPAKAQVDDAVRAQVTLGGRLGTVMVETAHIDLDELAKVLGRQHRLPAALEAHFQRADAELQQLLSPELAAAHQCVPLVRAGSRVIVAATDPLDDAARDAIAAGLGIEPERVVVAIAAELRVHYYLELVYGIARAPRYLRPAPSDDSGPSEDNFEYDERRRYVKTLATIAERAESRAKDKAPSVAMVNARTENENIELIFDLGCAASRPATAAPRPRASASRRSRTTSRTVRRRSCSRSAGRSRCRGSGSAATAPSCPRSRCGSTSPGSARPRSSARRSRGRSPATTARSTSC